MNPTSGENNGHDGLEALSKLARESVRTPSPVRLGRGLQTLTARMSDENERRTLRLRWALLGTSVACVALGIATATLLPRFTQPTSLAKLSYTIKNGSLVEGGYLRESGNTGVRLAFSEGTQFDLRPGTRGRLRSVDSTGARIAIEQGTASFNVTPGGGRSWLVDVGPFLVTVKGTIFTVSWDASRERFELFLERGQVVVRGPVLGGDITLQAGQRLVTDLPTSQTTISKQTADAIAVPTRATLPESPVASVAPATMAVRHSGRNVANLSPAPPDAKPEGERRWAYALAAGEWDKILADAERRGVRATLEKAGSEDLFALANAARYRRRMDIAREALLAERRRFPSSNRSLDAAFLLGRVEESTERGMDRAIRWYDEYLARAPVGTYAAEALGRKMILTGKRHGNANARPLAEDYLRRFPEGSYAGTARALCRNP